jgi:hypothetical protein
MKTLLSHWLETFPFFKQTWQHTRIERKFIAQFYFSLFSPNRALEFLKEGRLVFRRSNVAT